MSTSLRVATLMEVDIRTLPEVSRFRAMPGLGVEGQVDGRQLSGGSAAYQAALMGAEPELARAVEELSGKGRTPLVFARDQQLLGVIAVADAQVDKTKSK